jgi:hypothetical protein
MLYAINYISIIRAYYTPEGRRNLIARGDKRRIKGKEAYEIQTQ